MAKPSNMGTYNQNLEFPDENVFQKSFKESRTEAKNLAEEAYTKKKEGFLKDFYTDLRFKIMPPKGSQVVIKDADSGKMRINKGFYDISKVDPEDILREAYAMADRKGIPRSMIDEQEILSDRTNNLFNEAAKRQYRELALYRDRYGEDAFEELMENEFAQGDDFHKMWLQYQDPWAEYPGLSSYSPEDFKVDETGKHVRNRATEEWKSKAKANGFEFNSNGQVVGIPGQFDPINPVDVEWDEQGRAYIDNRSLGGLLSWNSLALWQGRDWLSHWGGSGHGSRRYLSR
jgi:hypothetical protein